MPKFWRSYRKTSHQRFKDERDLMHQFSPSGFEGRGCHRVTMCGLQKLTATSGRHSKKKIETLTQHLRFCSTKYAWNQTWNSRWDIANMLNSTFLGNQQKTQSHQPRLLTHNSLWVKKWVSNKGRECHCKSPHCQYFVTQHKELKQL